METTTNILNDWNRMKTETENMVIAVSLKFYDHARERERQGYLEWYQEGLIQLQLEVEAIEQCWEQLQIWVEEQLLNIECEETYAAVSHDIISAIAEFNDRVILTGMDIPQADA